MNLQDLSEFCEFVKTALKSAQDQVEHHLNSEIKAVKDQFKLISDKLKEYQKDSKDESETASLGTLSSSPVKTQQEDDLMTKLKMINKFSCLQLSRSQVTTLNVRIKVPEYMMDSLSDKYA